MEKKIDAETMDYLDFIRDLGIEAWIPKLPGCGPEMSVADQCRSRVICINYNGTDIYVQGNGVRRDFFKHQDHVNSVETEKDTSLDRFEGADFDNTNSNLGVETVDITSPAAKTTANDSRHFFGDQCRLGSLVTSNSSTNQNRLERSVEPWIDFGIVYDETRIVQETKELPSPMYFSGDLGVQYKRVVDEKITKEVRVAKSNVVTSLPIIEWKKNANRRHLDDSSRSGKTQSSVEIKKKSTLRTGFVRKLIEGFEARNSDQL